MDLSTLFLLLVTADLALVAYGVVGARRRLHGRARTFAVALMVVLPPLLIAAALGLAGEAGLVRAWWRLFVLMGVSGAVVAIMAERVARRVMP